MNEVKTKYIKCGKRPRLAEYEDRYGQSNGYHYVMFKDPFYVEQKKFLDLDRFQNFPLSKITAEDVGLTIEHQELMKKSNGRNMWIFTGQQDPIWMPNHYTSCFVVIDDQNNDKLTRWPFKWTLLSYALSIKATLLNIKRRLSWKSKNQSKKA